MNFQTKTSLPVYLAADIRAIEQLVVATAPAIGLMERAGLAAAEIARNIIAERGRVLVIAGPGNNGGDALVVARHLKSWWFDVTVCFKGDAAKLSPPALLAWQAWRDHGGNFVTDIPAGTRWGLVIDGLFGIGLQRPLTTEYAALISALQQLQVPVLALDLPSGLDADTGRVLGCAVRAEHTVTFIGLKPGLLTLDGPDHCGKIHLCSLDIDPATLPASQGAVIGDDIIATALPARRSNSHKGDYGSVGILAGAAGMTGAALLAARAALHLGCGRVHVGLLDEHAPRLDLLQPELMLRDIASVLKLPHLSCLAVGPGLGQTPTAFQIVATALRSPQPLVLDADALNIIAAQPSLQQQITKRRAATLLTPHPAEAARLLATTTDAVQADRIAAACDLATRYSSHVVLKGAGSICAAPDGRWFINTGGNPGMASAGVGDALTGIIAALLAQGADAATALLAGVHLHGMAGDALAAAGQSIMTASEVIMAAANITGRHPQQ
jgi:hydroxyethylthiazole kinase-like uncharacterized protein yjeF